VVAHHQVVVVASVPLPAAVDFLAVNVNLPVVLLMNSFSFQVAEQYQRRRCQAVVLQCFLVSINKQH
jgi:hypothetical protein